MAPKRIIAGFWSYVHHDDEHENGRITRLQKRLERSIRFYSGNRDFRIFLDRSDIGWGEKWAHRITTSLDDALLLFTVVSPSYLSSPPCREEALAFQKRQTTLERDDLILPIYYLTTDQMESSDQAGSTSEEREVAELFSARQYEDWRTLRETSETDPAYAKAIERLAQRACEALKRSAVLDGKSGRQDDGSAGTAAHEGPEQRESRATPTVDAANAAQTHVPTAAGTTPGHVITLTVNPMPGRAQFTTISEAVARAPGGARILIAPGHYRESVVIDKPLELIGDGLREDIIIEAEGPEPLVFDTNIGVVRNLTLRQRQKTPADYCVWIKQGRLELEDCDLSSSGKACLAVMNNADPRVRRNRFHDCVDAGIFVYDQGRGTYEDNEVFGNARSGIVVTTGAEPVMRRNRIYDGKQSGIFVCDEGRGTYEDNEVFGNALAGVAVRTGAEPVMRRNRIYDGKQGGIFVYDEGRGTYEDNEVFGNALAGVQAKTGGSPAVRRNRIHDGKQGGIYVYDEGRGTYENNEVFGNAKSGVEAKSGGDPIVRRNRIYDGRQNGILVSEEGRGAYEDNEVFGNAFAGIKVLAGGDPMVRNNRITGNIKAGVQIAEGGSGVFEDNDLRESPGKPWDIHPSAEAQVKRARNREK